MPDKEKKYFRTIVTHPRPDFEEYFAIWLLRMFGEVALHGVTDAEIRYWTEAEFGGKSGEELMQEGIIPIGRGGYPFDEHPYRDHPAIKDESSVTLAEKYLREHDPLVCEELDRLRTLIDFARRRDLELGGRDTEFDPPNIVKLLHAQYPDKPEMAMEYAFTVIDAVYYGNRDFWAVAEDFETAQFFELHRPQGEPLRVTLVFSDNTMAQRYARSKQGGRADIVVQVCQTGNVVILTNALRKINVPEIARVIRIAEREAEGKIAHGSRHSPASDAVQGIERWFLHQKCLLNGSLKAPDVPATLLLPEKIVELIRMAIGDVFPETRENDCRMGICAAFCSAEPDRQCSWFKFGLKRCVRIRTEEEKMELMILAA